MHTLLSMDQSPQGQRILPEQYCLLRLLVHSLAGPGIMQMTLATQHGICKAGLYSTVRCMQGCCSMNVQCLIHWS